MMLDVNLEDEAGEDGANVDLDSQRKCKCVVLKTSTRQYEGHKDDPTVPEDSFTPTLASVVLRISNERLDGVPSIMKADKALDARKAEICVQFKDASGDIFKYSNKPQLDEGHQTGILSTIKHIVEVRDLKDLFVGVVPRVGRRALQQAFAFS